MGNLYNNADKDLANENIAEKNVKKPLIRLGVLTTMYKRFDLAEIVFANIAYLKNALKEHLEIIPVVAGSEGQASREIALRHGFLYIEVDNMPLGKKHNAALSLFKDKNIDGIVLIGSDDLLCEKYIRVLLEKIIAGHKIIGVDIFYIFDRYSSRLLKWLGYPPPREGEPIGLGRFIHRQYLERLDYKLWDDERLNALDANMWHKLKQCAIQFNETFSYYQIKCEENDIVLLDIKHEVQMWSIEEMLLGAECIEIVGNADIFLRKSFPHVPWDTIFFVPPPSYPNLKLENISYPIASGRHIAFILPGIHGEIFSDMVYSYVSLISQCRSKGYRVSIISFDNDYSDVSLRHCGLNRGDVHHIHSILKYASHSIHKNIPDVLIYCINGENVQYFSAALAVCKIIKTEKIIADVRFAESENILDLIQPANCVVLTSEQQKMLAKTNAIPLEKELCCYELYNASLHEVVFLAREYRPDMAINIDFEGFEDAIKSIAESINGKFNNWKEQNIRLFISYDSKMQDKKINDALSEYNIFITQNTNYQMWNKIFCIHIFDLKSKRIAHCAEVLMTGTPVIVHTSMAERLGVGEEHGLFAVNDYDEAFSVAAILYRDKDMWEQAAKNALNSKKIFASELYLSLLN